MPNLLKSCIDSATVIRTFQAPSKWITRTQPAGILLYICLASDSPASITNTVISGSSVS